ncbi:unnamed protein product [Caenorhabditis angaria]|uniref:Epg5-like central TPR repeats domain-containing protein n=1 Tax=Caenorhabditis angaria TaxID=860376 RepID=A0A9P1MVH1_9PELO|nr:unnamed protein product [Caenorhabditis angaria]
MQQAAAGLPPQQFAALLPIAFANLASQLDSKSELHRLCLQHVIFFIFHQFPSNIVGGLSLAIEGCNTRTTPVSLLEAFSDKLEAREILKKKTNLDLGAAKADECARVLAEKLDDARKNKPNFYGIWGKYMDEISRLAQLFLFVPIRDSYIPNQQSSIIQHELVQSFHRIIAVFSPLIAPYSPNHPPFSPNNDKEANMVLERFVELLNSLHYNSSIPPGMENVQSLVWQYYFEKLSILTTGDQHYYEVLECQLVRLNWQLLWPSKHAVLAMEKCIELRSPYCSSFVSQIFVRIPWTTILQQMNEENRPAYLAAIFGVLARIGSRPRNYEKVRASLTDLVRSISSRNDWSYVEKDDAERLSITVGSCLPADSLSNPAEIVGAIQLIWRKLCSFVPKEQFSQETLAKQKIWLRTECHLLLKSEASLIPAAYNSLISDVNSIAINHTNLRAFCQVSRELTALWKNISESKLGESLVSLWNEYLGTNPNSSLVLSSLNTLIESLNSDQLTTALKVMEKTITAYFLRTDSSWTELMQWIQFPNNSVKSIKNYLLTVPNSENKVQAQPLTLRVFMDYGNSRDENMFFELHNYIINIKPKHISNESALICLLARLVQWISARYIHLTTNISQSDDLLTPLIRWLNKSAKDESSFLTNLISSKKVSHSPKLRVIFQIFELYLMQQSLGDGKKPRCEVNSPVLNSRIGTLKDVAQQKSNQFMSNAFNKATVYFTQVEIHNIQSANKMLLDISKATFGDRFLNDT